MTVTGFDGQASCATAALALAAIAAANNRRLNMRNPPDLLLCRDDSMLARGAICCGKREDAVAHEALKKKLITGGRILAAHGQGDFTRGHISARLPGKKPLFIMKPHSVGLEEITPANILTIDLDGKVVAGKARRHSEVFIHSEIYRVREDVGCVIHSHPPYTVALSASGRGLRALSQPGALFYKSVGLFDATIDLIRTPEVGAAVAAALGPHRAVLLKNHGVAVVGATIEEAVIGAISLENAAMIQMVTEATGTPAADFSDADIATLAANLSRPEQFAINFDYLARKLKTR
jgi:L-fuculose-phosphate aldolase